MHQDALRETVDAIEGLRQLEGGGRAYIVRGRIWGTWSVAAGLAVKPAPSGEVTEGEQERAAEPDERADVISRAPTSDRTVITGTASSTGVDHHETEMSLAGLESMVPQFKAGVPYAPIHRMREWHEIIGRTFNARIERAEVKNAAEPDEDQYRLIVDTRINESRELGAMLVQALRSGDSVGQSIGGWFRRISIVEDSDGRIVRVIVDEVELDHLAATRSPSNMDSDDLTVRDRLAPLVRAYEATGEPVERTAPGLEQRHVLSVTEDETTVTVIYAKPAGEESSRTQDATEEAPEVAPPEVKTSEEADAEEAEARTEEPEEATEESSPDAVVAEGNTRSDGDEPEDNHQEIDMDPNELRALLAGVVGEALAPLEQRLVAVESRGTPEVEQIDAEATLVDAASQRQIDELKKQLADAVAERDGNTEFMEKLIGGPVRRTRPFADVQRVVEAAMDAELGDYGALIERTKEEGKFPTLVRVSERSRALKRIRSLDDDGDATEVGYTKPDEIRKDMRAALRDLCRAANRDGMLDQFNPMKQAHTAWARK